MASGMKALYDLGGGWFFDAQRSHSKRFATSVPCTCKLLGFQHDCPVPRILRVQARAGLGHFLQIEICRTVFSTAQFDDLLHQALSFVELASVEMFKCCVEGGKPGRVLRKIHGGAQHFINADRLNLAYDQKPAYRAKLHIRAELAPREFGNQNISVEIFIDAFQSRSKVGGIADQGVIEAKS